MKKTLVLLCALLLAAAAAILPARAADTAMQIKIADQRCAAGSSVDVAVTLENNPGIASLKLIVFYEEDCLTYESAAFCGDFAKKAGVSLAQKTTVNGKSCVILNWVCTSEKVADSTFATLRFKAKDRPTKEEATLTLQTDADNVFDAELKNVPYTLSNGKITLISAAIGVETTEQADGLRFQIKNLGLPEEQRVRVVIAFSDANGRQSGFAVSESVAAENLDALQLIGANRKADDAWKLFVLDADSLAPLCESISSS